MLTKLSNFCNKAETGRKLSLGLDSRSVRFALGLSLISVCSQVNAAGYGIYDARSLAMGGSGVAVGTTDNGFFYNPSLLAFHEEREDKSLDGRFYFPMLAGQASESSIDAYDLVREDLDVQLGDSLDAYNAAPSIDNATNALNVVRELEAALDGVINQDIIADTYAGIAVTEPGVLGGGAFFVGARVIGGGVANVPEDDQELFREYIAALEFISTEGAEGQENAHLFDVDGSFLDPYDSINSTITARGAVIMETGVAVAKQIQWRNYRFTGGITPKLMRLRTFDEARIVTDENVDVNSNIESHLTFNADLGISVQYGEYWRLGIATKDAFKQDFETELDNTINLVPRSRLGLAFIHPIVSIGIDYDIEKSTPFVNEAIRQDVAIGAEVDLWNYAKLRLGYRTDLESNYANTTSFGVGVNYRRWIMDLAFLQSEGEIGGALQFGRAF